MDSIEAFYLNVPDHNVPETTIVRQTQPILPFFDQDSHGRFLDIGCHNGIKMRLIADYIKADLVVGVDFPGPFLYQAQTQLAHCIACDFNQVSPIAFADETFDCIHAGELVEHLFSPDHILQEIYRLLRPSGYAVITTPNLASWRNRLLLALGWQPFETEVSTYVRVGNPLAPKGPLAGHIRMFTPGALSELSAYYGLKVERIRGRSAATTSSSRFGIIDHFFEMVRPTLCDGLILRARKI